MAYNYFPQTYQAQAYYPSQPNAFQGVGSVGANPSNAQQNSLIWVQGEGAAKSYLVAPGCTVALFDNESQTIYIKSADASGMPSMKILDYTFRESVPHGKDIQPVSDYASKEDVDYLKNEIESLKAKYEDMKGAKK